MSELSILVDESGDFGDVVEHSNVSDDRFCSLMLNTGELINDVVTIVNGEEAVSIGLCDEVGTLSEALKCLHEMIDRNKANR